MPLKQVFLERTPQVPEQVLDNLEQLLRTKIDLKTGYGEPHALSRCMFQLLKTIDTSDDQVMTKDSFQVIMNKLNCGDDKLACAALFHRFDRRGTGRVTLRDFSDGMFGLLPVAGSDVECREIVGVIRQILQGRGENGFRRLSQALRTFDSKVGGNGLTRDDLQKALHMCNVDLTQYEINTLSFYFDKDGSGRITVSEFMVGVRPKMSEARMSLVKLAFLRLEKNPDGLVTFGSLKNIFLPGKNPSVLRGEKTVDQVRNEFISSWGLSDNVAISESDFIDFYQDLSACIDNDSYFELMVRNSWNITGVNTKGLVVGGPVRVVVTHMDGTCTIEKLDADLGVDTSTPQSLVATLRKQGVTDILKAEVALYR